MNDIPAISICLPVFNGLPHLERAIESALEQTFTDFELVVVDDGSTDGSEGIISRFLEDPRVTYFRNPERLGLFANYNECMKRSRAPVIKLFAQDDVLAPEALGRMKKVLDSDSDVALVSVAKRWIDAEGTEVAAANRHEVMISRPFEQDSKIDGKHVVREAITCGINWLGEPSTMMFRREAMGEGFDLRFRQLGDLEFWFRILFHGDYFFISDRLCDFRRHESSATASCNPVAVLFDFMILGDKYPDVLLQKGESVTHYYKRMLNWTCGRYAEESDSAIIEEQWEKTFRERQLIDFERCEEMHRRMAVAGMMRVSELLGNSNLKYEAELEEKIALLRFEADQMHTELRSWRRIKRLLHAPITAVSSLRTLVSKRRDGSIASES